MNLGLITHTINWNLLNIHIHIWIAYSKYCMPGEFQAWVNSILYINLLVLPLAKIHYIVVELVYPYICVYACVSSGVFITVNVHCLYLRPMWVMRVCTWTPACASTLILRYFYWCATCYYLCFLWFHFKNRCQGLISDGMYL